jgi:hypothetical protein
MYEKFHYNFKDLKELSEKRRTFPINPIVLNRFSKAFCRKIVVENFENKRKS